ncbi:MAG: toll/interleukin-1 receptor domain-containing protein [Granulosicoccus sp.]|nr:toll/interleukin-1 receptor domain-containing protein [Granulosicoccus sp.]
MEKRLIFLSYRRDDSPGYVSRLEHDLERVFGDGRVFRDATDIPGGTKWKEVIDTNLRSSAVLLLIIGPRWEQIWRERINDEVNYVALELQRAHELNVPIIPVSLDGTRLSTDLDLGGIHFIHENQFHDISDRQGRWRSDFEQLVSLLESIPGMGQARTTGTASSTSTDNGGRSGLKWLAAVAGLVIIAAIWFGSGIGVEAPATIADPLHPSGDLTVVQREPTTPPLADVNTAQTADVPSAATVTRALPDISGTWRGQDGTVYVVQQFDDGTFVVDSPGYGTGQGRFFADMPRKFEVEMVGIGRGEFSVSASDDKAMGWIIIDGQQEFDTLIRID